MTQTLDLSVKVHVQIRQFFFRTVRSASLWKQTLKETGKRTDKADIITDHNIDEEDTDI